MYVIETDLGRFEGETEKEAKALLRKAEKAHAAERKAQSERYSAHHEPYAQEVDVCLMADDFGGHFVKTPWAALHAADGADTTDERLAAMLRGSFDTEAEALGEIERVVPHFRRPDNLAVSSRLHDAIRWHGDFSGPLRLADAVELTQEELYDVAMGKRKATRAVAKAARDWKGGPA